MRIVGDAGFNAQAWSGFEYVVGQTLDSSSPVRQKTVNTLRERTSREIFVVYSIGEPVVPVR